MQIDPRKLVYFATIVDLGSIKKAAKAVGITQPAMSMSMDRLEAELQTKLFERSSTGISVTPIGDTLYFHARIIRAELQHAERDIASALTGSSGEVRLGSLPSLANSVVPHALSLWRGQHPDIGLHVVEAAQIDLLTGVLRREFDLVFGYTECYDIEAGLRQKVLFRDRLCLIARPSHPLTAVQNLSWSDVATFPWISPTPRRPHSVLEAALRRAKVPSPVQSTFCGSVSLQKTLVASSDHLAMLPEHAVKDALDDGQLISLPIESQELHRNIAVFFREGFILDTPSRDLIAQVGAVGLSLCAGAGNGKPRANPTPEQRPIRAIQV